VGVDVGVRKTWWPVFWSQKTGLFAAKPAVYISILVCSFLGSFIYGLRFDNIFACQATGYTADRYLSICDVKNYGDYEHGAFWFNLEPAAERSAEGADVVILGNSRAQFAFSTDATAQWFSSSSAKYYLLGFVGWENSVFARALLRKLKPRAQVYVVAIEDYFEPFERPFARVIHDPAARSRYESKRLLQSYHKAICMKVSGICGNGSAIFRSRETGMYYMPDKSQFRSRGVPVSDDKQIDQRQIDDAIGIGHVFLSELPVRPECVILTVVPTVGEKLNAARAVASGLEKMLVEPEDLDGLQTFDGFHLDRESAERWSDAFFKVAGAQIRQCLIGQSSGTTSSVIRQ
jgi:hypothetical protein